MHHASSHWDDVCGWAERTVHDTVLELKTICCIRDSIYMQAIVQVEYRWLVVRPKQFTVCEIVPPRLTLVSIGCYHA